MCTQKNQVMLTRPQKKEEVPEEKRGYIVISYYDAAEQRITELKEEKGKNKQ